MNKEICQLINYALGHHLITEDDVDFTVNSLLDLFHLEDFTKIDTEDAPLEEILSAMLDYAVNHGLCEDGTVSRDLFDTRIMGLLMPRPHEVIENFQKQYAISPQAATSYYYDLSIASNYIRMPRIEKNIRFKKGTKYGPIEITINLSKPEKDPKAIAAARLMKNSSYPQCLLCKENVGFAGDLRRPARENHRIIPLSLAGDRYYMQYSPYVYYNEHCIVFNEKHVPMKVDHQTFVHLLDFITQFPHYMLGSNADLPIVGGSILTHDHYQGGAYHFPIEDAKVMEVYHLKDCKAELLYWPLTTIRLTSASKERLIALADKILEKWIDYDDADHDILSHTGETRHNTITPIARRHGDDYVLDLVLRNNRTTDTYPLGIFHPHAENHHIKKENIGLIEVMGLAILPARLKDEMNLLKDCLLGQKNIDDYECLEKHKDWYQELSAQHITEENVDDVLRQGLTDVFTNVLENAGVYKMNDDGIAGFKKFVSYALEGE